MTRPDAAISMITLGVSNLETSLSFYVSLGWTDTRYSQESVKFLAGRNIVLGLFGRDALAEDAMVEAVPAGFAGTSFAVNLRSPEEVDDYHARAIASGGTSIKKPREAFWGGYSGYFADPDGHLWEVAHNPFFPFDDNGRLDLISENVS